MKAPYYRREGQGRGIPWRPCMPGERSAGQRGFTAIALGTVSYNVIHRLMGPMELRAVNRLLDQFMFAHWGSYGTPAS